MCAALSNGTPNPGICQTETITKPIQAHFGAEDNLAGFSAGRPLVKDYTRCYIFSSQL